MFSFNFIYVHVFAGLMRILFFPWSQCTSNTEVLYAIMFFLWIKQNPWTYRIVYIIILCEGHLAPLFDSQPVERVEQYFKNYFNSRRIKIMKRKNNVLYMVWKPRKSNMKRQVKFHCTPLGRSIDKYHITPWQEN